MCKRLETENAKLRKDAERLNYIEQEFHCLGFTQGSHYWMMIYKDDHRTFATMREAIDEAMQPHTDHPSRHWDRTCPACQEETK